MRIWIEEDEDLEASDDADDNRQLCSFCNGEGIAYCQEDEGDDDNYDFKTCPICNGSGYDDYVEENYDSED